MTKADVFRSKGYEIWNTGGGCTAWGIETIAGHILITDEGGCDIPQEDDTSIWVGFYDYEGIEQMPAQEFSWEAFTALLTVIGTVGDWQ